MMNILILQGSPRANGNTAWMAEEYRKAAEAVGHKVTLVAQKQQRRNLRFKSKVPDHLRIERIRFRQTIA